jgi:hypothetical protein
MFNDSTDMVSAIVTFKIIKVSSVSFKIKQKYFFLAQKNRCKQTRQLILTAQKILNL